MESGLNELLSGAPVLASVMLGCGVATILAAAASVSVTMLAAADPASPTRRALAWASLALFAAFAVALVVLVQGERAALAELVLVRDGSGYERATQVATSISVQLNGTWWGAAIGVLAGPAAAFGGALPRAFAAEAKDARGAILSVAVVAALLLGGVAGLAVAYAGDVVLTFGAVANADASDKAAILDDGMTYAAARFGAFAIAFIAVAAIGAAVATVLAMRAARDGALVGKGPLVAAALVLVAGVACFVATRPMAHDAEHPIAPPSSGIVIDPPDVATPQLDDCGPPTIVPIVQVTSATEATLDNRAVDPERFSEDLEVLRRNWSILHPRRPFPGRVAVVAEASLAVTELVPWLRAAYGTGYTEVEVRSARARTISTRSLGELERQESCAARFAIDRGGTPASAHATWGELARAASADERLRVAP